MREIAEGGLALLSAVGNILDLPGSMVRDVVAGENPIDQLATPATAENRVTGRELLQGAGMLRKSSGIGGTIAGMAAEVALDPFVLGSVGKAGVRAAAKQAVKLRRQRRRLMREIESVWGKDVGGGVSSTVDSYAALWSESTGRKPEEFYSLVKVRRGKPSDVGSAALRQGGGDLPEGRGLEAYYSQLLRVVDELPGRVTKKQLYDILVNNPSKTGIKREELIHMGLMEADAAGQLHFVPELNAKEKFTRGELKDWLTSQQAPLLVEIKADRLDELWSAAFITDIYEIIENHPIYRVTSDERYHAPLISEMVSYAQGRILGEPWRAQRHARESAREEVLRVYGRHWSKELDDLMNRVDEFASGVRPRIQELMQSAGVPRGMPVAGHTHFSDFNFPGGKNYRELLFAYTGKTNFRYNTPGHFTGTDNLIGFARVFDRETEDGLRLLYPEEIQSDLHQSGRVSGYVPEHVKHRSGISENIDLLKPRTGALLVPQEGSMTDEVARNFGDLSPLQRTEDGLVRLELRLRDLPDGRVQWTIDDYGVDIPPGRDWNEASENLIRFSQSLWNYGPPENLVGVTADVATDIPEGSFAKALAEAGVELDYGSVVPNFPWKNTWRDLIWKRMLYDAANLGYDGVGWPTPLLKAVQWQGPHNFPMGSLEWQRPGPEIIVTARGLSVFHGRAATLDRMLFSQAPSGVYVSAAPDGVYRLDRMIDPDVYKRVVSEPSGSITFDPPNLRVWGGNALFDLIYEKHPVSMMKKLGKKYGAKPELRNVRFDDALGPSYVFFFTPGLREKILSSKFSLFKAGRGAIEFGEDGRAVITAFSTADASTLHHELGHLFRRHMRSVNEPLLEQAERELGVVGGNWTREAEEQFAEEFERYMDEGFAATPAVGRLAEFFRKWASALYKSGTETEAGKRINPRLKEIFDKLSAGPGAGLMERGARAAGVSRAAIRPLSLQESETN